MAVARDDERAGRDFVVQLFETRRVLEGPIFALATVRADDATRAAVAALAACFHPDLDITEFRRLDREFHTTVAAACGNPLLIELYGKVLDSLFRSREFDELLSHRRNRQAVRRIVADSGAAHVAIAAAFCSGDAAAMDRCARDHVGDVAHAMVDVLV